MAEYLGWTLNAFAFFLVAFFFRLALTDAAIAAFVFGRLADRFGRQTIPMIEIHRFEIHRYSVLEFASGFARSSTSLSRTARPVRRGDGRRMGHRRVTRD